MYIHSLGTRLHDMILVTFRRVLCACMQPCIQLRAKDDGNQCGKECLTLCNSHSAKIQLSPYVRGDGYAPFSIIMLWTALSISSVVTPGCMKVSRVEHLIRQ